MEDLAKVAYEACQKFLRENAPEELAALGDADMSWEGLPRVYRDAWDAAAQAVLGVVNA